MGRAVRAWSTELAHAKSASELLDSALSRNMRRALVGLLLAGVLIASAIVTTIPDDCRSTAFEHRLFPACRERANRDGNRAALRLVASATLNRYQSLTVF